MPDEDNTVTEIELVMDKIRRTSERRDKLKELGRMGKNKRSTIARLNAELDQLFTRLETWLAPDNPRLQ